jgi:hypothetical protein
MMKNKNLKEVICGVIAVAAVFLSACGQTNDKKLDSTPEPSAEVTTETTVFSKVPVATPTPIPIEDLEKGILIIDDEKKTVTIRYEDFDVSKIEVTVVVYSTRNKKIYLEQRNTGNDIIYIIARDVISTAKGYANFKLEKGYELIIENEPALVKKQG